MLMVDQREFKQELHDLIDGADPGMPPPRWDTFREAVILLAKDYRASVVPEKLANSILKLVVANNKGRAHKLVDALKDEEFSKGGAFVVLVVGLMFVLAFLAGFVIFVVWAWGKIGG